MKINNLLLMILAFSVAICRKLKFIEVVTRHGVRYPSYPNNYDHSNISFNPNLKNQLTIQGKSMHYLLGKRLYQKYWGQLFENTSFIGSYSPSLIYAKSTNTNRTIESLQSQLLGLLQNVYPEARLENSKYLFPPFQGQQDKLINNQKERIQKLFTVPIHVQKGAEGDHKVANLNFQGDFLVKQQNNLCPNQIFWEQQNYQLQHVRQISQNQKIKKTLQQLNIIYNQTTITIKNAYKYVDNYRCLKAMGFDYLPFFQRPQYKEQLQFLYIVKLYISYFATEKQKRTFSTRLLDQTIKNMKNSLQQNTPKIVLYAAHDITIATLLVSFNFSNLQCITSTLLYKNSSAQCYSQYPAFASSFIFQLWEEDNGSFSIAIAMNGKNMEIPICDSKIYCSFSQIEEWFNTYRVESPNRQCGVFEEDTSDLQAYLFAAFSIGVLVSCCFQLYSPKSQGLSLNQLPQIEENESLYS